MKVEDCIVSVERRTIGGCVDLAFVFVRHFLGPLYKLTALFAIPCTLLVWAYGRVAGRDLAMPAYFVFCIFITMFSGALIAAVGPQVFGVPIRGRDAVKAMLARVFPYLIVSVLVGVTGMCLLVPLLFLKAWTGHLSEVMFLEKTPFSEVSGRLSWLVKGGGYSRNLGRIITLCTLWLLMALGTFLTIDFLSYQLFNIEIFAHSIADGPDVWKDRAGRLIDTPIVIVTAQASLWLTFPVIRLAWFFCYLDQRIRNECWDIDLQFRVEANRLEG